MWIRWGDALHVLDLPDHCSAVVLTRWPQVCDVLLLADHYERHQVGPCSLGL
jgi:hypothetical protein